eukprot:10753910-Alexandrium_andersonii.AAC.1
MCHFGLGASIARGAACPICRARAPPLVRATCQRLQWIIASSPRTPARPQDRDSRAILAHPVLRKGRLHDDT